MSASGDPVRKRNWKNDGQIIIVLIFCLVMVGLHVVYREKKTMADNVTSNAAGLQFESLVKGCNSTSEKISRAASLNVDDQAGHLEASSGTLTYRRTVSHPCCLTVELTHEQEQNTISITEQWSGTPCRCLCTTQLLGLFTDVPKKDYTVTVIEKTPTDEEKIILDQTVTIP